MKPPRRSAIPPPCKPRSAISKPVLPPSPQPHPPPTKAARIRHREFYPSRTKSIFRRAFSRHVVALIPPSRLFPRSAICISHPPNAAPTPRESPPDDLPRAPIHPARKARDHLNRIQVLSGVHHFVAD